MGFEEAFYSLKANQLRAVKMEICDECGWADSTFNSKRNGNRPLKKLEIAKLKEIFRRYNIRFRVQ